MSGCARIPLNNYEVKGMLNNPRMKVHIKRRTLFAEVTITNSAGQRLITTMDRAVQASDEAIRKLKCQFAHVQSSEVKS